MQIEEKITKTRQQLADEYCIDRKTLYRWLKAMGIQLSSRRLVTPAEQELIYQKLGKPKRHHKNK